MFLSRYHNHEAFLRHFQDRTEVFSVFEALWPKEFKKLGVNPCSPIADRIQAYQQLQDLLSEKLPLFEADWEAMMDEGDEEMEDGFIGNIPIMPQGSDDYQEWNLDYAPLASRVILTITSDFDDDIVKALVRERVPYEHIDGDALLDACIGQGAPGYLYDSFSMLYRCTGNEMLDITAEMYDQSEKPEWSVRGVKWFIAEWKAAQPIIKRAKQFDAWLEKDLRRIRQVENLLRQATKPRERVRIGGPQPQVRPLVETLGFLDVDDDESDEFTEWGLDDED